MGAANKELIISNANYHHAAAIAKLATRIRKHRSQNRPSRRAVAALLLAATCTCNVGTCPRGLHVSSVAFNTSTLTGRKLCRHSCHRMLLGSRESPAFCPTRNSESTLWEDDGRDLLCMAAELKPRPKRAQRQQTQRPADANAELRSVDWCGARGMLPLQRYSGSMPATRYERWLKRSLGESVSMTSRPLSSTSPKSYAPTWTSSTPPPSSADEEQRRRRQQRKLEAQTRASRPLDPRLHLKPIYVDAHIVAVAKPSGVMSVPGPRRNPSVANLVHTHFGNDADDVDKMIVHRLDLDTSGVVVYARTAQALGRLHDDFRYRNVKKTYEALLCGHLTVMEGEIDLLLRRDGRRPPFMCVSTDEDAEEVGEMTTDAAAGEGGDCDASLKKHAGYRRMISKAPKPSRTLFRVLSYEHMDSGDGDGRNRLPVTRVELIPVTGRTHQLRVHAAAIGHPIVGDDIYGYDGEGSANGGLSDEVMDRAFPRRATLGLQGEIFEAVQRRRRREVYTRVEVEANAEGGFRTEQRPGGSSGTLCLHARELCFLHPMTEAPIVCEATVPF